MTLAQGQTLLHYRLEGQIGEGGMGVVWRARDTSLDRDVAIKVLPQAFADDPERLARFEREAKLLASLNHPNIAAVYGLHEAEGARFLAMELVSGSDLAVRLSRGALPLDETLEVARQVADALSAAHESGVVHRDLKPSNIQIAEDGTVKVLDFGLAKALGAGPASGSVDVSLSPTVTSAGTMAGVILGTAAYMSPEQARGKAVDRRSDLWSFGCVLYEMLTGRGAFRGETVTDILSAVISQEPDRALLPASTPRSVRRLLDRCLAKAPRQRLRDAGDARLEIDATNNEEAVEADRAPGRSRSLLPWTVAAVGLSLALLAWVAGPGRSAPTSVPEVVAIDALTSQLGPELMPAISADGRNLAYVARDGEDMDIFLLRVGGENAINLTADYDGWDGEPAFSPDGERIAFASDRSEGGLYVMGATGESPRRVADGLTHPSWSPDGKKLVAATEQVPNPYSRATRSRIVLVDLESGETRDLPVGEDGVGPSWSPDGRHVAYWTEIDGQRDLWTIAVDGGQPVAVTEDAHTDWEPMWAEGGKALYFHSDRGGSADLWRIPIDPVGGGPLGPPTPLTVGVTPVWASSISADGKRLVASMSDHVSSLRAYPFDPQRPAVTGEPEVLLEVSGRLWQPNLSSDGGKMVFRTMRPRENIITLDLESGARQRLTDDEFRNRGPAWSPDGKWIAMYSNRGGPYQIWIMRPDGTDLQRIFDESSSDPMWSPAGDQLAINTDSGVRRWTATTLLIPDPDAAPGSFSWIPDGAPIEGFVAGPFSPDGRRIAGENREMREQAVYDLDAGGFRTYENPPPTSSDSGAWFSDSERLFYWDDLSNSAMVWNTTTGEQAPVPGVRGPGSPMLSPDNKTLYVIDYQRNGDIWMLTLERGGGS
jgi:Tol biopolymer transport system component